MVNLDTVSSTASGHGPQNDSGTSASPNFKGNKSRKCITLRYVTPWIFWQTYITVSKKNSTSIFSDGRDSSLRRNFANYLPDYPASYTRNFGRALCLRLQGKRRRITLRNYGNYLLNYTTNNPQVSEEPAATTFRTEGKAPSSETLATICQTTRRHIQEDARLHSNNQLNLKSRWFLSYLEFSSLECCQQAHYARNKEERRQFGNWENWAQKQIDSSLPLGNSPLNANRSNIFDRNQRSFFTFFFFNTIDFSYTLSMSTTDITVECYLLECDAM
jgi:hypothetical protein